MNAILAYRSILMTAVVAGVFSAIVCALMLFDGARRITKVPTDSPEFVAGRERLIAEPDNDELRQDIRDLDLALRREYFREQQFTETGSYLLLGGISLTLIMSRWAATIRRKLPAPKPKELGPDSDERLSRTGPWAVGAVMLVMAGTAWAMNMTYRSALPERLDELTALREQVKGEQPTAEQNANQQNTGEADRAAIPSLPTDDELRASWPSFRGPQGAGAWPHADVPIEWDAETGKRILWKTPVPLPGVNSPIVWKDRVFLSGATEERREVYCFDAVTGNILWQKEVTAARPPDGQVIKTSEDTGFAAPSMATDGRFVFAMFADGVVAGFDFTGNQVWRRSLGVPQQNNYGHASSLSTYQGSLIVQYDQGRPADGLSKLLALDGTTGELIWETDRPVASSWSSPVVIEHDGEPQVITSADPWVIAYSPQDGVELWRANCLDRAEVGPSPIYSDGMVFVVNDNAVLAAVRADGRGDVTDTHVQWTTDLGLSDTCSPLATTEFVLTLTSYGTLSCFDKHEGGEPLWEEDFGADFASSPTLVGERVYLFSTDGQAWIVQPTHDECQPIATSELGEECVASPAFQDGRMYIRGGEHLFCIGDVVVDINELTSQ